MIPYGKQTIGDEDVEAVVEVLRSNWLTTGPMVELFESAIAESVGTRHAVAVSSGTAALHTAMYAIGIGPDDEIIVPPMTFAATANCVIYQGGKPIFADVEKETLLLDVSAAEACITPRTKAIIAVDYAGQPCDYDALRDIATRYGLLLVDDACHALGAEHKGRKIGSIADATVFSLHPVKHITTGEGGVITTDNEEFARRMRMFRNHGIMCDSRQREREGGWFYSMEDLGFNYRLTDFQCALGLSQLKKLPIWVERRRAIAKRYDDAFAEIMFASPLGRRSEVLHAYHLYVIRLELKQLKTGREEIFNALRTKGIGVNVHYIPVPWHPFYQQRGYQKGSWPVAEASYERLLSLPIFPAMTDGDVNCVIESVKKVLKLYSV